ncbi:ABC transporter ATP-binding protein [Candidatus Sumerlaeota bacterium]|nr:ABC transporter ATP-binding protein [Candidatus Sumerlaeota bacterium]
MSIQPEARETAIPIGTIHFRNVSKTYQILHRASPRIGAWVLNKAFEYFRRDDFHAIQDISFDIKPGEMVGLVGSNGAGKSTILKLIAGITEPSSGEIMVGGPVTSLLELGVGFHPDLTGMENIFYNGAIMGMSRDVILSRLERIVEFSGLADFLYEPVKHYSSGMYSRLACSVALHLEPKIILVDEILAVGDAEFQQKSIMKLLKLHEEGVTTLLVSHQTETSRDLCDRLLWIDGGKLRSEGTPARVHAEYVRHVMEQAEIPGPFSRSIARSDGRARIDHVALHVEGREADAVHTDQACAVEIKVSGTEKTIRVALKWTWTDGRLLSQEISDPFALGDSSSAVVRYEIARWPLMPARVELDVAVLDESGTVLFHRVESPLRIRVLTAGASLEETLVRPRVTAVLNRVERIV